MATLSRVWEIVKQITADVFNESVYRYNICAIEF